MWTKFNKDGNCYRARTISIVEKDGGLFGRFFVKKFNRHYIEIEKLEFENDLYYPLTKQCIQYTWFLRTMEEADDISYEVDLVEKSKQIIDSYEEDLRREQKIQMNRMRRVTVIE